MGAVEWRTVPGFPDYQVSSEGDIVRVVPGKRNHKLSGRPLRVSCNYAGYKGAILSKEGKQFNVRINRVVCEAFHGSPPGVDYHAAHNDGDRSNNTASNLRWASPVENNADKHIHGTAVTGDRHRALHPVETRSRGSAHGRSKLHESDIPKIRADTRYQRTIAKDYGVTQRVIWMVKAGKIWGHVA